MSDRKLAKLLCAIGRAAREEVGTPDARLLERFLTHRDEAAFELLVRRHQRLVFGVCRRVLQDNHDAEDAYQATFLVLARKAASIGRREVLAAWLYRVTLRIALRARSRRARRALQQMPLTATGNIASEPGPLPAEQHEASAIVDEELSRLPQRFREAAILCYLQGKTVDEAARQLGCPRGTIASRLARARERLRVRLSKRGVTLTAGAAVAALSEIDSSPAAVERLTRSALRVAALYIAGKAAADPGIPLQAMKLAQEALKAMFVKKLATNAAVLILLSGMFFLGGSAFVRVRAPAAPPVTPAPESPAPQQAVRDEKTAAKSQQVPHAPVPVAVSHPLQRIFTPCVDYMGHLEAPAFDPHLFEVGVWSALDGRLIAVNYKKGDHFKKGDVLFQLDPEPFKAALAKAEAKLGSASAASVQADVKLKEAKQGLAAGSANQKTVEEIAAAAGAAKRAEGAARLEADSARRDLQSTRIVASADGTVDAVLVNRGDLVSGRDPARAARPLARVRLEHVMGLHFDMDESAYIRYRRLQAAGEVKGPGSNLAVGLADETGFPHEAMLESFNDRVNPAKGTIGVHAVLPDPEGLMLPGMSARVRMPCGKPRPALFVSREAIKGRATNGGPVTFAWVVDKDNVAEQRQIKVLQYGPDLCVIGSGLTANDWVVVDPNFPTTPSAAKVDPRPVPMPREESFAL